MVDTLCPGAAGRVRDELGQHLRIGGGHELDPLLGQLVAQPAGVGEIAVVAEHELAAVGLGVHRLHVRQRVRAGRAVAGVPDRRLRRPRPVVAALEPVKGLLVEDAADEPEALVQAELRAVTDSDAGRFLAAMLERVEPDIRHAGDGVAGRPDADDAALLARPVRLVEG